MAENSSCQICDSNRSKYSCPRCNLLYCSLSCYQSEKHLQCSEAFYEKWVQEELKNRNIDPEAKRKMLEIIKKEYEDSSESNSLDSDDEEEVPDLTARMSNVNLDDEEAVWSKLTPEEKQEFKKLVTTGSIIKILPEWEPWWKTKKRKALIQECDKDDFDCNFDCPSVPKDICELSQLTKSTPSPNIPFMVLNVLMSYIFTIRWFKGSHLDMPVEAISTCVALSATLRNNQVFTSAVEAFIAFEDDLLKCEWVKSDDTIDRNSIQEDLSDIILGSSNDDSYFCVKAALSDLNSLCSKSLIIIKECKKNSLKRFSGPPPKPSQIQQISKKMLYYLSWIQAHGNTLSDILLTFK